MSLKKNMKDIRKGLTGILKETLEKGQEAVHTVAAGVEQYTSFGGVRKLTKDIAQKGREAKTYVEERGGLAQIAEETAQKAMDAAEGLMQRVNEKYGQFEQELFTDGRLNQEKVDAALNNAGEFTKKYGMQAVAKLRELAAKGADVASTSYRDFCPDKYERQTTYAGIGNKVPFYILTRSDGDKCLNFHEEIRNAIEGRPKYKGQILADIKSYVLTDRKQLINFYKEAGNAEMADIAKKL